MTKEILLLAAENGALPRGKVGGIGDVIRDLPLALAKQGWKPVVMTPAYGMFAKGKNSKQITSINVAFAGNTHKVKVCQITGPDNRVKHIVLDSPRFSPQGDGLIYCDDGENTPFATDASKFAFFCAAAAVCVTEKVVTPVVIHCHDWHAALFLALRKFAPEYATLKKIRTVYTIHNLALQGIRPLREHASSFETWFPGIKYDVSDVVDPRYHDCINPMALAIRLADKLNTVSPTYAQEILLANNPEQGFFGGEGLEHDLTVAHKQARLVGILNACEYPSKSLRRPSWKALRDTISSTLIQWISKHTLVHSAHFLAQTKLSTSLKKKPPTLLVSIGRLTTQKASLFLHQTAKGDFALVEILQLLEQDAVFILLGSGDPELESIFTRLSAEHANFLFLKGYADVLPDLLYSAGDLFLMPSSFEPCGISQMLAMRAGQLCVVNGVGGLKDTVEHLHNGFVFHANSPMQQADEFVKTVAHALNMKANESVAWKALRKNASDARFSWDKAAQAYINDLYADPQINNKINNK